MIHLTQTFLNIKYLEHKHTDMKIGLIGFGQAGGKIADRLVEYNYETNSNIIVDAIAINSARADLMGLENIPEDKRVLIGTSEVKGHGVGADNELGAEIAENSKQEIQNAIDTFAAHEIEAFVIVSALGGGTGSGGTPVLARHLQHIYQEPVYGVGILPASEEGSIYSLNAARSFQTVVDEVDSLIMFDNDEWRQSGESVGEGYEEMNEELIRRLGLLFSAGEISKGEDVGESVVDSSEIINTLGERGLASIGYASEEVETADSGGLLSRLRGSDDDSLQDSGEDVNRMNSLARKAALSRLTLNCQIDSTERALVLFAGPPEKLSRKGIERARKWIEEETGSMEVRGGDYPIPGSDKVACIVLFAGVTNSQRIKEMQQIGVEAQDNIEEIREQSEQDLENLLDSSNATDENDDDDELDSLF